MTDDIQRRPHPPGWTAPPPGSHYNPYDPLDKRPPQGYPSEFNTPGNEGSNWSSVPTDASQYQQMRTTMRKLQYTPRPHSELYPGQFKQLRRVNSYTKFDKGVSLASGVLVVGVVVYSGFIYRWNDGYENIFSGLYRSHLKFKQWLVGSLSQEELNDLTPTYRTGVRLTEKLPAISSNEVQYIDSDIALERPERRHVVEAQRVLQEQEERVLKALDIAEQQLKK